MRTGLQTSGWEKSEGVPQTRQIVIRCRAVFSAELNFPGGLRGLLLT